MNEIQTMSPILPLWGEVSEKKTCSASESQGPSLPFADVFRQAVDNVKETDAAKNEAQYLLATGQLDNPAELTIVQTQAAMSVELLVQLRNKALDEYSELMRISMKQIGRASCRERV